ncbi:MAG TPA: DUF4384 domain-containing protein [Polyangiales bacterium]|nr:DUF4384 domain-containing protein [Polyangiales bacterium]
MLLASALGCGHAYKESVAPGKEQYCPDGTALPGKTILTMDCNMAVRYDASELSATVTLDKLGEAGLKHSAVALRQIDQAASDMQLHFMQTCRQYNGCQLTHDELEAARQQAQSFFRVLREKLSIVQSAGADSAATRTAFNELYQHAVPSVERAKQTLEVTLQVVGRDADSSATRVMHDGETLRTGAKLAFDVRVSQQAHTYLFQRSQSGKIDVLFPNGGIVKAGNPLPASTSVRLPPPGQLFTLNAQDLGTETVFLAVSREPIADLERALASASPDQARVATVVDTLLTQGQPECAGETRGLELTSDVGCGSATRGLTLTPDPAAGVEAPTLVARNAAGDDTIVRSFRFAHVQ